MDRSLTQYAMKKNISLFLIGSLFVILPVHAQEKTPATISPNALYQAGIQAMNQGEIAMAQKYLTAAKKANHPHADYQLGQLSANREGLIAKKRELMLKKIIIDKVQFVDAELSDVITLLAKKITDKDPQYTPNFVIRDPNKKLHDVRIDLELTNVPATVILENVMTIASSKAKFGEYSIVIQPQ